MHENAFFVEHQENRQPGVDAHLASALENFPQSDLLKKFGELSAQDRNHVEYALNLVGETIALLGDFEESSEESAVVETLAKIDAFVQASDDQKRGLAKALVDSIRI